MARGWVYVLTNLALPDLVKVGFTLKDTKLRAQELSHTGVPGKWVVQYEAYVVNPREIEQKAHKSLKQYLHSKEFFTCTVETAVAVLKEASIGNCQFENKFHAAEDVEQNLEFHSGYWFDSWSGSGTYEGQTLNGSRHGK